MLRKISFNQFEALKKSGHIVPRCEKTGNVISFSVGKVYKLGNNKNTETINVTCTQSCPTSLSLNKN